jgi:hypothetical protein
MNKKILLCLISIFTACFGFQQLNAQDNQESKEFKKLQTDYNDLTKRYYLSEKSANDFKSRIQAFQTSFPNNIHKTELADFLKGMATKRTETQERIQKALEEALMEAANIATDEKLTPKQILQKTMKIHPDKFPQPPFNEDQVSVIIGLTKTITSLGDRELKVNERKKYEKKLATLVLEDAQKLKINLQKNTLDRLKAKAGESVYTVPTAGPSESSSSTASSSSTTPEEEEIKKKLTDIDQRIKRASKDLLNEFSNLQKALNEKPFSATTMLRNLSIFKDIINNLYKTSEDIKNDFESIKAKYININLMPSQDRESERLNENIDKLQHNLTIFQREGGIISSLDELINSITDISAKIEDYKQNPQNKSLENQINSLFNKIQITINSIKGFTLPSLMQLKFDNIDNILKDLKQKFTDAQKEKRSEYVDNVLPILEELKQSISQIQETLIAKTEYILKYPTIETLENLEPARQKLENIKDDLYELGQKYEKYNEIMKEISIRKSGRIRGFTKYPPETTSQEQDNALNSIRESIEELQTQYEKYSKTAGELGSFLLNLHNLYEEFKQYKKNPSEQVKKRVNLDISELQQLSKTLSNLLNIELPNITNIIHTIPLDMENIKPTTQTPPVHATSSATSSREQTQVERIIQECLNQQNN